VEALRQFSVRRFQDAATQRAADWVATEEPLVILVSHCQKDVRTTASLAITMRTPGHDKELALGLLLSEGVIRKQADVTDTRLLGCNPTSEVLVELASDVDFESWRIARNGLVTSSCGVCGKRSLDAVKQDMPPLAPDQFAVRADVIHRLPETLRAHQPNFAQSGGLHAAALVSATGGFEAVFEDIGRHNALDKLIGWAFLNGLLPLRQRIVFMSSRGSFELVQKAALAGAPILAAVGGPSSLAIEAARELNVTLLGFVRDQRFNVYSVESRIESD
jgi:FdhD protein